MNERVKTLVHERKISKLQIGDLESQIQDLNDRLFLAERKSAVTATVGKRHTHELKSEVLELQQQVACQRKQERKLKRNIEDLHF